MTTTDRRHWRFCVANPSHFQLKPNRIFPKRGRIWYERIWKSSYMYCVYENWSFTCEILGVLPFFISKHSRDVSIKMNEWTAITTARGTRAIISLSPGLTAVFDTKLLMIIECSCWDINRRIIAHKEEAGSNAHARQPFMYCQSGNRADFFIFPHSYDRNFVWTMIFICICWN